MATLPDSDLAGFAREIDRLDLFPLWERKSAMVPGSSCVPALWRYADVRPELLRAAELITARDAERRVLVLENPALRGTTFITDALYAGLQIILPGEIARSHRHSPSALRFIVEGEGAYSAIDGERVTMRPGDFVVTPNWAWHDHGNLGAGPVVWLDGLDTPIAKFFGALFREEHPQESQPLIRAEGPASPILSYPYERTRAALDHLARTQPQDPAHGTRLRYANPSTGGDPFPTMAAFMQKLPTGFAGEAYRSTDGAVFAVVEGAGAVEIAGHRYDFAPHDVFVVPPWAQYRLNASAETVLFSYSDRAAQEKLGLWREQR